MQVRKSKTRIDESIRPQRDTPGTLSNYSGSTSSSIGCTYRLRVSELVLLTAVGLEGHVRKMRVVVVGAGTAVISPPVLNGVTSGEWQYSRGSSDVLVLDFL